MIEQNKIWTEFYTGNAQIYTPSHFAMSVLPQMEPGRRLLDVGCGNGRDSQFFAQNGLQVTAVDLNQEAIAILQKNCPSVRAVCDNAATSTIFAGESYDYVYTRFFIHALRAEDEARVLKQCYAAMHEGSKLFIETRCIEDELCGEGVQISETEWAVEGHYRRFIIPEKLTAELDALGLRNIRSEKSRGFAPFQGNDPIVLRIIAEK